ncbi:NF038122 family metalloprotease [Roseateles sp. DXS20W]|uniref:NF038122 family metalloprotease n=1 Tax=Pelomonas lactea TaxID=3299030 RepID=A0ABW7GDV0_9BURK
MQSRFFRTAAPALALAVAGLAAPAAQALDIVFRDVGPTPMSSAQFAAFESAASLWKSKLSDHLTVYIDIGFDDLGGGTLATTTWAQYGLSYGDLRSRLAADATSAADTSAVTHLQAGTSLSFMATLPGNVRHLDNDGSANNRQLLLTTANAKALGVLNPGTNESSPDARIRFSNAYAGNFAYSRSGGVPYDKIDFISVAEHEIGHALGFVSGVDAIDYCLDHAAQCGTAGGFEAGSWYYSLDLLRYSAPGTLDVAVGGAPYLSLDGGATALQGFSTGAAHGDGSQASHFLNGSNTLMRPIVPWGQSFTTTDADLLALDAIGWNLTNPVPEPQTYALLLSGLAVLGWARRRRGGVSA